MKSLSTYINEALLVNESSFVSIQKLKPFKLHGEKYYASCFTWDGITVQVSVESDEAGPYEMNIDPHTNTVIKSSFVDNSRKDYHADDNNQIMSIINKQMLKIDLTKYKK